MHMPLSSTNIEYRATRLGTCTNLEYGEVTEEHSQSNPSIIDSCLHVKALDLPSVAGHA